LVDSSVVPSLEYRVESSGEVSLEACELPDESAEFSDVPPEVSEESPDPFDPAEEFPESDLEFD
jgi:hypothetical protein